MSKFRDSTKEQLDFKYADKYGLPFAGNVPLMTEAELDDATLTKAAVKYGLFNATKPDHRQSGRTLSQIYNASAAGVFQIIYQDYRWEEGKSTDKSSGIRSKMVVFVVWKELSQTTRKQYWQNVQQTVSG